MGWHPIGINTNQWEKLDLGNLTVRWLEWKSPIYACVFFAVYGLSN